jgi:hypothetical protein
VVTIDDDSGTSESRASVGGSLADLDEGRLITAKLDKQTQQRGDYLFARKN